MPGTPRQDLTIQQIGGGNLHAESPHIWPFGKVAPLAMMIPTMTPKRPRALPKISTINIFTKSSGFCASPRAQPLPDTPTQMPQTRLDNPTERPTENKQYPATMESACHPVGVASGTNWAEVNILLDMMIAM